MSHFLEEDANEEEILFVPLFFLLIFVELEFNCSINITVLREGLLSLTHFALSLNLQKFELDTWLRPKPMVDTTEKSGHFSIK